MLEEFRVISAINTGLPYRRLVAFTRSTRKAINQAKAKCNHFSLFLKRRNKASFLPISHKPITMPIISRVVSIVLRLLELASAAIVAGIVSFTLNQLTLLYEKQTI